MRGELDLDRASVALKLICKNHSTLRGSRDDSLSFAQRCHELADEMTKLSERMPKTIGHEIWTLMAGGTRLLATDHRCIGLASTGESGLLEERSRLEVLAAEFEKTLRKLGEKSSEFIEIADEIFSDGTLDRERLHFFLAELPLPTPYLWNRESGVRFDAHREQTLPAPSPMLYVTIDIDGAPLVSPTLLKANILYPLKLKLRGLHWPPDSSRLKLDFLTTCPSDVFSISEFILDQNNQEDDEVFEEDLPGNIAFKSGQSSMLEDLVFSISASFEGPNEEMKEVQLIGHNEMRLRIVDDQLTPLMVGNRVLDRHVVELISSLEKDLPSIRAEEPSLLEMLQALTRLRSTYAQEAIFKGESNVPESQFQSTVLHDLRNVLGPEVQEHPGQGGGIMDIRYRGLTVELKVERENGNRKSIGEKYSAQATQYSGVDARQVSIVLVLDLTSKESPPGDIRDDIFIVDVRTHGGVDAEKRFPSKAVLVVVNGNMKNPSSYSK